jgi:protein TonB
MHAIFIVVATSVRGGAPVPEPGPPDGPVSISFVESPPGFSFAEPPAVVDFVEFAEPEQPIFDVEDDPMDELEETEMEPPPEAQVSVEIPIPVEAVLVREEPGESREEPAADTAPALSENESIEAQDEEQAVLIRPPEFLSGLNHPPKYPRLARRRGYEGEVLLELEVLPDGAVGRVAVVGSSGFDVLDEAAVAAAARWLFIPAKGGKAGAASLVRVPVVFRLR